MKGVGEVRRLARAHQRTRRLRARRPRASRARATLGKRRKKARNSRDVVRLGRLGGRPRGGRWDGRTMDGAARRRAARARARQSAVQPRTEGEAKKGQHGAPEGRGLKKCHRQVWGRAQGRGAGWGGGTESRQTGYGIEPAARARRARRRPRAGIRGRGAGGRVIRGQGGTRRGAARPRAGARGGESTAIGHTGRTEASGRPK
jgi:hypothetical protein